MVAVLDFALDVGHFLLELALAARRLSAAIYRRVFRSN